MEEKKLVPMDGMRKLIAERMKASQNQNAQADQTNKMMTWMMPLMSLWIGFTVPAGLSVYWIIEGRRGWCSAGALCGFAAVLAAYLFDLAWYAVFFCTRLTVFAILLLFAAVCLNVLSVLAFRRRFFITAITALPVIGAEIFSICRTVSIFLLN